MLPARKSGAHKITFVYIIKCTGGGHSACTNMLWWLYFLRRERERERPRANENAFSRITLSHARVYMTKWKFVRISIAHTHSHVGFYPHATISDGVLFVLCVCALWPYRVIIRTRARSFLWRCVCCAFFASDAVKYMLHKMYPSVMWQLYVLLNYIYT